MPGQSEDKGTGSSPLLPGCRCADGILVAEDHCKILCPALPPRKGSQEGLCPFCKIWRMERKWSLYFATTIPERYRNRTQRYLTGATGTNFRGDNTAGFCYSLPQTRAEISGKYDHNKIDKNLTIWYNTARTDRTGKGWDW